MSIQPRLWVVAAVLPLALVQAQESSGNLRAGEPVVMAPPALSTVPRSSPVPGFRQRYTELGRPGVVILWNQRLDDQLKSTVDRVQWRSQGETRTGERTVDAARRPRVLAERDDEQLRAAFNRVLRDAGVAPVDRGMAMRLTELRNSPDRSDAKRVEIQALVDKARFLIEVLQVDDSQAPLGLSFIVSIKDLQQITEVVQFVTRGLLPATSVPGRYVASATGFQWFQPSPPDPGLSEVGEQLALETLTHWQDANAGVRAETNVQVRP